MASKLNGKGNVVFFSIPGQPNIDERLKGYKDAFLKYPGIKVIDVFDMKGDSGVAMDQTKDYLLRTGVNRIDAIICLEAASGRDVAEEFRRTGVKGSAAGCDGCGSAGVAGDQGWNDRFDDLAEALHDGVGGVEDVG